MSRLFDELLRVRGVSRGFLRPRYEETIEPELMPDMERAIQRLRRARDEGEKVLIYGDYDVDGVTSSTVMHETLSLAGIEVAEIMLPNRFTDGYGMSPKVATRAQELGVGLVITVDCGSRNHEIISGLKKVGIETIVTDHHECGATLPEAVAILNPKRRDIMQCAQEMRGGELIEGDLEKLEELRDLAGVGVAFKLAQGMVRVGMVPEGQEKWLLDLVLIGTICDSMQLTGENRRLCYYGLKVLAKTRRVGLKELLRLAGTRRLDGEAIGFQIGPRLNAAGRMETAEKALRVLMAKTRVEAANGAMELEKLNRKRKQQQNDALAEIQERGVGEDPVIVVQGDWHEGVLGIIAGRLVEEYHRPAFVLARPTEPSIILEKVDATSGQQKPVSSRKSSSDVTELTFAKQVSAEPGTSSVSQIIDGSVGLANTNEGVSADSIDEIEDCSIILKGSGRSFGDFNLAEALTACEKYIIGGGGHAEACGVKVEQGKLDEFREAMCEYYRSLRLRNQEDFFMTEADIEVESVEDLSLELLEELQQLEPYGPGNLEPVFLLRNARVVEASRLGDDEKHLRLVVLDEQGKSLKLMSFGAPEEYLRLSGGEVIDVWLTLCENEFRGIRSVEGRVVGIV